MDDPAQNPNSNQTDPLRVSFTDNTPPPPSQEETPVVPPETSTEPIVPPADQYPPTVPPEITPSTETPPVQKDPNPYMQSGAEIATPPQESLTPQENVNPPQAEQYQAAPWAAQPPNTAEQTTDYSQYPPTPPDQTTPGTTPPPPPEPPKSSSPKGFIIGGLLALIIVAGIFGAMTLLSKNGNDIPVPPVSNNNSVPKTAAPAPVATQSVPTPAQLTPSPTATPKTVETYINSTYKYQFNYPLSLSAPTFVPVDQTRFPKALEVISMPLSSGTASSSAYFIVWQSVSDVPKYITDGQSQFVKVNQYTTNRFTIKKADNSEETHYLTQKFNNAYDIMLQNPAGKISDPVFEKILDSFTFIETVSAAGSATPAATPAKTSSPSATAKPSI